MIPSYFHVNRPFFEHDFSSFLSIYSKFFEIKDLQERLPHSTVYHVRHNGPRRHLVPLLHLVYGSSPRGTREGPAISLAVSPRQDGNYYRALIARATPIKSRQLGSSMRVHGKLLFSREQRPQRRLLEKGADFGDWLFVFFRSAATDRKISVAAQNACNDQMLRLVEQKNFQKFDGVRVQCLTNFSGQSSSDGKRIVIACSIEPIDPST